MLSYETALEQLGFDYNNEFNNMENELPSVLDGVLGILGSPFQQSKTQPTQNAPTGTPSNGRPKGQVPKKKQPSTDTKTKTKVPNQSPSNQPSTGSQGTDINIKTLITSAADIMDEEQFKSFLDGFLNELKNANSE
jgi:hypothetical protein